ncbi:hypothetical protein V7S57_02390 [Caulobacter sp. CCNWLY153]|uniref:hypothetical protein n=1 Tax=unclassified Caulobacter TaxID=2648921 RepID=UPI002FF3F09D
MKTEWKKLATGDWHYMVDGVRGGAVVFQDLGDGKTWYSVSSALEHDATPGKLAECKRRLERLWAERLADGGGG